MKNMLMVFKFGLKIWTKTYTNIVWCFAFQQSHIHTTELVLVFQGPRPYQYINLAGFPNCTFISRLVADRDEINMNSIFQTVTRQKHMVFS